MDATIARESVCNNSALRRAARRMAQWYDEAMAPVGLRGTQYTILLQIDRAGGEPLVGKLAEALVMDLSALGHTLRALQREGLVEVVVDAADRRSRRARLTHSGKARLAKARVQWARAQRRFEAAFGVEDAARLRGVLDFIASPDFDERLRGQAD
ncbi:MAG TPA: MarR family winged helix-turn-helix transcriptional regulator [Bordetella sp.]